MIMKISEADLKASPTITIGGETFHIPKLAPKQNRRIVPRIARLGQIDVNKLDEQTMDDLYEIVFWALTRGYPETDQAEFMDRAIDVAECMRAIPVIAQQTGIMKMNADGTVKDDAPGEAQAINQE